MCAIVFAGIIVTSCSGGNSALPNTSAQAEAFASARRLAAGSTVGPNDGRIAMIALSDNFSTDTVGGTATGWIAASGTWSVCRNGTANAYCQTLTPVGGTAFNGASWWSDYRVEADVIDPNVWYGGADIIGRAISPDHYYQLELRPEYNGSRAFWYLLKYNRGTYTADASGPLRAPD